MDIQMKLNVEIIYAHVSDNEKMTCKYVTSSNTHFNFQIYYFQM